MVPSVDRKYARFYPILKKFSLSGNFDFQKPSVLSEAGYETEKSPQGAGVRTRMLDGALHQDEHRVQKKGSQRL